MINKIIPILLILLIIIGGFSAIYFREKPIVNTGDVKETIKEKTPTKAIPEIIHVGILGESRSDGTQEPSFNQDVLLKFFKILNDHNADAIFFTGTLTFGWSRSNEKNLKPASNDIFQKINNVGVNWEAKGFTYDRVFFRNQLNQFHTLVNDNFKYPEAFYPLMGTHEAIGSDALEIFQTEFKIKNNAPNESGQLRYTVSLGNAFFAMIPTNYYDTGQNRAIEHTVTPDTLSWLQTVLKEAKLTHEFLFVLGHEPAYSMPSIFNRAHGLDNNPEQRDAFWGVLRENDVLAYFSSHEHVYDRSYRDGTWQIISGGGGSPLYGEGENNQAFFHCLLLEIPQKKNGVPSVTVLDKDGNIRDYFELSRDKQPLHQFHISWMRKY